MGNAKVATGAAAALATAIVVNVCGIMKHYGWEVPADVQSANLGALTFIIGYFLHVSDANPPAPPPQP